MHKARVLAYLLSVLSVGAAVGLKILFPVLTHSPFGLFLAAILLSAGLGGLGPGLIATALAGLGINYFFLNFSSTAVMNTQSVRNKKARGGSPRRA